MNNTLKILFQDNPELSSQIAQFCASDPEYMKVERRFYETAHEIAKIVGYELYDTFEARFGEFLSQPANTYYFFGLGLRQEVIRALNADA